MIYIFGLEQIGMKLQAQLLTLGVSAHVYDDQTGISQLQYVYREIHEQIILSWDSDPMKTLYKTANLPDLSRFKNIDCLIDPSVSYYLEQLVRNYGIELMDLITTQMKAKFENPWKFLGSFLLLNVTTTYIVIEHPEINHATL